MRMVRSVGTAVGLLGNVLIGVAIFHLLQQGSCGDFGQPTCPAGLGWYVAMIPIGIIASMVGMFLGGGFLFGTTFLSVGLGAMAAAAFGSNGSMRAFGWVFGGAFALVGVLAVTGRLAFGRLLAGQTADAARLVATGAPATAVVTDVRDTGVTVNDNPQVVLTVRIEPADGRPPYDSSATRTVSRVAIPRVGDRLAVRVDPADPQRWLPVGEAFSAAPDVASAAPGPAPEADPGAGPAPAPAPSPSPSPVDELGKLNDLRLRGALTEDEFAQAKSRLLRRIGDGS
jgi:hypothetical protein